VHADAPTGGATDWRQILALYDQLLAVSPTPVVALNRAVAVAEVDGPAAALGLVDGLAASHAAVLGEHRPLHAIRANLLERLGRRQDAARALAAALACPGNAADDRVLARRRAELE
jgi:RNA polymerase sigma-70 factor (ECF subfamily)